MWISVLWPHCGLVRERDWSFNQEAKGSCSVSRNYLSCWSVLKRSKISILSTSFKPEPFSIFNCLLAVICLCQDSWYIYAPQSSQSLLRVSEPERGDRGLHFFKYRRGGTWTRLSIWPLWSSSGQFHTWDLADGGTDLLINSFARWSKGFKLMSTTVHQQASTNGLWYFGMDRQ